MTRHDQPATPADLPEMRRRIAELAREHLAPSEAEHLLSLLRPAVRLQHAVGGNGRSHVGGSPVLDDAKQWPTWNGTPLSFLMQLDLAELAGYETDLALPSAGRLSFFFEAKRQDAWGYDPAHAGASCVLFSEGPGQVVAAPAGARTFAEVSIRPVQVLTAPGWEEEVLAPITQSNGDGLVDFSEALSAATSPGPVHQVGGWPEFIQYPAWLECQLASNGIDVGKGDGYESALAAALEPGAEEWQLLMQLDTDEMAGWQWGDAGSLYFAIRGADLEQMHFDRTWTVLQCF